MSLKYSLFVLLFSLICIQISFGQDRPYKLCDDKYKQTVNKVCTFGSENTPCLDESKSADLSNRCCTNGCTFDDIKPICCFTNECLARCYPGKRYNVGTVY
ncbi:hypothetical protein Ddc_07015 [Ditylenchus destructor]|nr:hypothetical protein Ddc_07015 [Ditylenchus destructor]